MMDFLTKIFGSKHDRDVKKLQPVVEEINALCDEYANLSDEALQNKTTDFRNRVAEGTEESQKNLTQLQEELDWIDTTRHVHPEPEKLFSWWSYRARDWSTSDRGRRLDHIWVTSPLKPFITNSSILREARGWEKPSDHVPVTTELQLH